MQDIMQDIMQGQDIMQDIMQGHNAGTDGSVTIVSRLKEWGQSRLSPYFSDAGR
jgi:hypothetical protein